MKKTSLLFVLPVLAGFMMGCGGKGGHSGLFSSSETTSQTSQTSQSTEVSESTVTSESTQVSESTQTSTDTSSQSEESTSVSESTSQESSEQSSFSSPESEKNQTYNFYIDYSHSDTPYFTMKWWSGVVLGEVPSECQLTSADAPDEAYPTFLGWSKYSSSVDDPKLWDFTKDASLNKVVDLYGIWVSE